MKPSTTFRFRLTWQRRLSGLLSVALCVWLLAFATHLHAADQDVQGGHSSVHLCGVCASIPTGAAAPAVAVFATASVREQYAPAARVAQILSNPVLASYRSRAPPAR